MNYYEWKNAHGLGIQLDFKFYNESHKLMKKFNIVNGTNKTEVHHLRDTEEQRNYNDTHYELWGFNEDGTFEYGKYVVFFTHDEHVSYHSQSAETRKKLSDNNAKYWLGKHHSDETRIKMSESAKHRPPESEDTKRKRSLHSKKIWEDAECRERMTSAIKHTISTKSEEEIKAKFTKEVRDKISMASKAMWNDPKYREKMASSMKDLAEMNKERTRMLSLQYKTYKQNGGNMLWNEYQKAYKNGHIIIEDDQYEQC